MARNVSAEMGRLAPWLFGWMFCLPFLLPLHGLPLPSFYAEWLAMLLGLAACAALWLAGGALTVPRIALAPLALLAVLALQYGLGMFAYGATALMLALVLLWCALLMVAGRMLAAQHDVALPCVFLARFLLAGGVLNALAGLLQYAGWWAVFAPLVAEPMPLARVGVYGNLAQQNHFATHLALALASAVYLTLSRQLTRGWLAVWAAILLLALLLSGSRSGVLYVLYLAGLLLCLRQQPWPAMRRPVWAVLLVGIALLCWLALQSGPGPLARWATLPEALGVRSFLWRHALAMFFDKPVLGVGFDAFAAQLVTQIDAAGQINRWGIDQYAHNLPLQILAWSGLCGFVALVVPGWGFVRRQLLIPLSLPRMWFCAVTGMLLIHSMLEQPLFYAWFLAMFALLLGMFESSAWQCPMPRGIKAVVTVVLVLGLGLLLKSAADYGQIAAYLYPDPAPRTMSAPARQYRHQVLLDLHRTSLFAPLIELAAPGDLLPDSAPVQERIAFNLRVMHYAPVAAVELRHALLLAEAGHLPQAKAQLQRTMLVWPRERASSLQRIHAIATQDPHTYGELASWAEIKFLKLPADGDASHSFAP
jgi:O-antigen ligase